MLEGDLFGSLCHHLTKILQLTKLSEDMLEFVCFRPKVFSFASVLTLLELCCSWGPTSLLRSLADLECDWQVTLMKHKHHMGPFLGNGNNFK